MKFSIITVTYKDSIGLRGTLKSLAKLSKKNYEHIIIDGGSKDKTLEVIRENSALIDKWVSEPDKGIYDAMNKGLKLVNDKDNIVSFLNAGDLALDNYFEDPKRCFVDNQNINYCYGGIILVGKKKESIYLPKNFDKNSEYLQRMVFPHPALFVKKNIFLKIGYFNVYKKITADHEWCVRLIKSGVKGKRFDSPVVKFKLGGASLKLSAQFEVFQTALQYNRNIIIAVIFLARQLISRFYYIYKSKC
jgi:glycosyltransferase involved in cell wall biosynthesis